MKIFTYIATIFFILFSFSLHSEECEKNYTYTIEKKKKEFCVLKGSHYLVAQNCLGDKCGYQKAIDAKGFREIKLPNHELKHGKNPATLLCKKAGGKLVPVRSEFQHQSYFCRFNDNSMISSQSLYQAYSKK